MESIFIPSKVRYIESRAFVFCNKLTSIEVSKNNKKLATFDGCVYTNNYVTLILIPSGKNKIVFHEKLFLMNIWVYYLCEIYEYSLFDKMPGIYEITNSILQYGQDP